jgi:uncharacterized protein (TIGR01777 family)
MKIVIPGGTGQIGNLLAHAFHESGHEVVVLSRTPHDYPWRTALWDASTLGEWTREIDGADVVINLAGRSVNCRYNPANRKTIMDSRVESTRAVGQAIAQSTSPPRIWLQMSTATIYAHRYGAPNDEYSGVIGEAPDAPDTWHFSVGVARAWESATNSIETPRTRRVLLRSAIVMSARAGGAFDVFLGLVRRGLGGRAGNGKQFVSWIHGTDAVRAIEWIIEHEELNGAVNLCAPRPLPNAAFMQAIRRAWGARIGLPAPQGILEIATRLMKTESELVLKSRRVVPAKLLESGFRFDFPNWPDAARDLCAQVRTSPSSKSRR